MSDAKTGGKIQTHGDVSQTRDAEHLLFVAVQKATQNFI